MESFIHIIGSVAIFVTLYFEVFLLISLFEKNSDASGAALAQESFTPGVTVIVPAHNEESTIAKTLDSLLALDYPKENLKIIVVNDGSTDGTSKSLECYAANTQIKIVEKPNGGKYTALNLGIEMAETDFVGCLDADSFVDREALQKIMQRFTDPKVMAVTPSMHVSKPNNIIRKMQRAEYSYGNFLRKAYSKIGAVHITPGPFSFFRKEVFAKIGMYRHAYNTEDMEMAMRMQKNGMKIANASDAFVYTVGPESVKKLYRQRVRWVSGFIRNLVDYKEMLFSKKFGDLGMIVLPFSVIGILLSLTFIAIGIYKTIAKIVTMIIQFSVVGIHFSPMNFTLDWFFTDTSTLTILSLTMIATVIALVVYGDSAPHKKWNFSFDALYFVFIYSFIAPFWLVASVYNNITSKIAPWR